MVAGIIFAALMFLYGKVNKEADRVNGLNGKGVETETKTKKQNTDSNDYYIEIPAGGYGMTFKTQMNKASVTKEFCTKGAKLTFETFTPWHKVEGNDASGLQSYVH